MLRVTAIVVKEGVYDYLANECNDPSLSGIDPVRQYIPRTEFTDQALVSLEGKPVIINAHTWRDTTNILTDGLTVGAVAGNPRITADGCIVCDMIIYDGPTIRRIESKELIEVSAGYDSVTRAGSGEFNGYPYHAWQSTLRFNHLLLLLKGQGRLGHDVRILNSQAKRTQGAYMPTSLQLTIAGKTRTFTFADEQDATQLQAIVEEEQTFTAKRIREVENDTAALKTQLEEQSLLLQRAEARVKELLSPEDQQARARQMVEQHSDEQAIIDAETENSAAAEKTREELHTALQSCPSLDQRRAQVVDRIMNMRGVTVDGWSQDRFDGAFATLASAARKQTQARLTQPERIMNGGAIATVARDALDNRTRMLAPMQARNQRRHNA